MHRRSKSAIQLAPFAIAGVVMLVAGAVALTVSILSYRNSLWRIHEHATKETIGKCDQLARQMEGDLAVARQLTLSLGSFGKVLRGERKACEETLSLLLDSSPSQLIYGMGLWYDKDRFPGPMPLFGPYVHRKSEHGITLTYMWSGQDYDYTQHAWYQLARDKNGAQAFTEPYFDTDNIYVSSVVYFRDELERPLGVATVDVTLASLRSFLRRHLPNANSVVYLCTRDQRLLFHTNEERILQEARNSGRPVRTILDLHEDDLSKLQGTGVFYAEASSQMNSVGWSIHIVEADAEGNADLVRSRRLLLVSVLVILVISLGSSSLFWYFNRRQLTERLQQDQLLFEVGKRRADEVRMARRRKLLESLIRRKTTQLEKAVEERNQFTVCLESANRDLHAANQELEAFSYSVSHDLRHPLRNIIGFIELLQKRLLGAPDKERDRCIDVIKSEARRLDELINALLAFSRINKADLKMEPVDLRQLVELLQSEFAQGFTGRSIEWIVHPMPLVFGDQLLLRQVLANLVGNAVKFTRHRENAVIEIGALAELTSEGLRVIYVRDNGAGFNPQYADKLYKIFQRLHSNREFEGTGIGLANVRRIIVRHGGHTWAEGEENKGATFFFSIRPCMSSAN